MTMYDISVPLSKELPIWPGDPGLSIALSSSMARGDNANVTRLELGVHTATHIDAPNHFEKDGIGIDQIPLEILIGPCRLFNVTEVAEGIDRPVLKRLDGLCHDATRLRWARLRSV